MTMSTIIRDSANAVLPEDVRKIPWDEPAFSRRMLENHLSQEHDWDPAAQTSSTRFMAIEENVNVTRFGSQMTARMRRHGRSATLLPTSCTHCWPKKTNLILLLLTQ